MRFLTFFVVTSFVMLQAWAEGPITVKKEPLADFQDCRSEIGWGDSSGEIEGSAQSIGDSIVNLLSEWAHGDYARK
jgi:hypothetical protein